jgi:hypothetical protein
MRLRLLVAAAAVTALPLMLGGATASASTVHARTVQATRAVQAAPVASAVPMHRAVHGLPVVGAGAAPAHQAAHARMMTVTPSTSDPYQFENENALWIVGNYHGEDLTGIDASNGDEYDQYSQGGGWYTYSLNDFCWNTLGEAGDAVAMDSCPSGDTNEWFEDASIKNSGYVELVSYVHDLCIWGAGNEKALVLETCSATNARDLWDKIP